MAHLTQEYLHWQWPKTEPKMAQPSSRITIPACGAITAFLAKPATQKMAHPTHEYLHWQWPQTEPKLTHPNKD
jgi:hypothetical protein